MGEQLIEQVKALQLDILKELDRICKEYELRYTAAFGTVLGAVRHGGFIPWDDDIDIYMEYEDYKKLEDIASEALDRCFYFQSRKANAKNFVYWNRIGLKNTTSIDKNLAHIHADWGICIDIFPLLPLGNTCQEVERSMKTYRKMNKWCLKHLMINTCDECSGVDRIKRKIHRVVPDVLSVYMVNTWMDKLGKKGMHVKYCTSGTGGYVLKTEWFKDIEYVCFEDIKIPLMGGGKNTCLKYMEIVI